MGTFTFNIDQVPGAPVDADSAKTFKYLKNKSRQAA